MTDWRENQPTQNYTITMINSHLIKPKGDTTTINLHLNFRGTLPAQMFEITFSTPETRDHQDLACNLDNAGLTPRSLLFSKYDGTSKARYLDKETADLVMTDPSLHSMITSDLVEIELLDQATEDHSKKIVIRGINARCPDEVAADKAIPLHLHFDTVRSSVKSGKKTLFITMDSSVAARCMIRRGTYLDAKDLWIIEPYEANPSTKLKCILTLNIPDVNLLTAYDLVWEKTKNKPAGIARQDSKTFIVSFYEKMNLEQELSNSGLNISMRVPRPLLRKRANAVAPPAPTYRRRT